MTEDNTIEQASNTRVRFPGISPRAYEHPADRGALATLRAVPGITAVLKTLAGLWPERAERLYALASSVRVGPRQYPKLDRLRIECAETLDLERVPNLFVARHPVDLAMAIGIDEPFIVLTTGLVERYDLEGMRFVIGHEMGHVLSGHAVLRTLLFRLLRIQNAVNWVPLGVIGLRAVIAALLEWFRKAELTSDRAGLLCGQDPAAALRVHMYMAGGSEQAEIDISAFLEQAKEYEETDDFRDSILKMMTVEGMSHPFAVVRAAQLQRWAASEDYRTILSGQYQRREDDNPSSTLMDDVKSAAQSYKDSWSTSKDPLIKVVNNVGEAVSGAAGKVFSKFGGGRSEPPADEEEPNGASS
jgi:Zn-dependent protease with chaperone function